LISKNLAELFETFGKTRENQSQPNLEDLLSLLKGVLSAKECSAEKNFFPYFISRVISAALSL
jgi:hypothetical protein